MITNDALYEAAKKAVMDLFGDTSVSQKTTRDNLEALISEMQILIDTLKEDDDA